MPRKCDVMHDESDVDEADADENELRAISACSLRCFSLLQPSEKVLQGPGVGPGPRRYLGVVKPYMLYQWCLKWCLEQLQPQPSFSTFMRVLHECSGWIRFRKAAGQHPTCDFCLCLVWAFDCVRVCFRIEWRSASKFVFVSLTFIGLVSCVCVLLFLAPRTCKKKLRSKLSPLERADCMEEYLRHLMAQWQDREADLRWATLSVQLTASMRVLQARVWGKHFHHCLDLKSCSMASECGRKTIFKNLLVEKVLVFE